jgi:hypothetical protein
VIIPYMYTVYLEQFHPPPLYSAHLKLASHKLSKRRVQIGKLGKRQVTRVRLKLILSLKNSSKKVGKC